MTKYIPLAIRQHPEWELDDISFYTLGKSCQRARERGIKGKGKYKNVKCEMTPAKLRDALWEDGKFHEKWDALTKQWIESGYQRSLRPTLDRIDDSGNYELDNIQALSSKDNTSKGSSKKCILIWYDEDFLLQSSNCLGIGKVQKIFLLPKEKARERNPFKVFGADYVWFDTTPEILANVKFVKRPNFLQKIEEQRLKEELESAVKVIK
jgi:hypothetical protein